jgi:cyclic pyranopterin phosphate synthase
LTEDQIVPFGKLARETDTIVRFIEFMPLDADSQWQRDKVLFAHEIMGRLEAEFGALRAIDSPVSALVHAGTTASLLTQADAATHAPAQDYEFADGKGRIGLIASVSQPFCSSCNRFRLTADGRLRNCLFSHDETDIKQFLRSDSADELIAEAMLNSIAAKKEGHEINTARFVQPDRPMYSIGG